MIKMEREIKNKITCKGLVKDINEAGFHFEDTKTGDIEVLPLAELKRIFVGKEANFGFADSEKKGIDSEEETVEE